MYIIKADESKLKEIFRFDKFCYQDGTIKLVISWIFIFLILLGMHSISCVAVRPLHQSNPISSCECIDESYVNLSEIDKNIKRYNPEISKTIYLTSNFGSLTKTLKVYKYRNNNGIDRILLFHIADMFTYELKLDTLIIEGGNIIFRKKIYDDASVKIGNVQDLLFYITLNENEYNGIIDINKLLFRIDDMTLELNSDCKNKVFY